MKKYILATDYDEEGFDYDGAGDYFYTATNYDEHDSKEEILTSLKKNIYYECRKKKPNFNNKNHKPQLRGIPELLNTIFE